MRIIVRDSRLFGLVSGMVNRALARVQEPPADELKSSWLLTEDTGMPSVVILAHTPDEARAAAKFLLAVAKDAERKQVKVA